MIFLHFLAILFWVAFSGGTPEFKRSDYSLQYTKPVAPTLQNPVHDWNPLIPCCIVRVNLQQPSHCASIHYWPYMLHLSPRVLPTLHWNVHSLGLTNAEHASYLHFVWTNKHMIMWFWYTCCVDYIVKGTFRQGRFTSATNTWVYHQQTCSSDHSTWVWARDWWGAFYPKLYISISGDSWRHDQTGPIIW